MAKRCSGTYLKGISNLPWLSLVVRTVARFVGVLSRMAALRNRIWSVAIQAPTRLRCCCRQANQGIASLEFQARVYDSLDGRC